MLHRCEDCGDVYEAATARSKYCSRTCSARASRKRTQAARAGGSVSRLGLAGPYEPGPTETATRSDLEKIRQADSSTGAASLALAREIDRGGATLASLSREWRQLMAEARAAGSAPVGSIADQLRQKREERLAAASGA